MRNRAEEVLYVGKAKNLRNRLRSYRVANPDRMPQRHLRLLRAVTCIELECCENERAALALESHLLLALRPRFNRAGTWRGPRGFLAWRCTGEALEVTISQSANAETAPRTSLHTTLSESEPDAPFGEGISLEPAEVVTDGPWHRHGPLAASTVSRLRGSLARLLWFALHPECGAIQMPAGWLRDRFPAVTRVTPVGRRESPSSGSGAPGGGLQKPNGPSEGLAAQPQHSALAQASLALQRLSAGQPGSFCEWIEAQCPSRDSGFERSILDRDMDLVSRSVRIPSR